MVTDIKDIKNQSGGILIKAGDKVGIEKPRPSFASNLGELLGQLLDTSIRPAKEKFVRQLCRELARYTGLPENHIYPVSGDLTALELICRSFITLRSSVVIAGPSETSFTEIAGRSGAEIREVFGISPFEIDVESLTEVMTLKKGLVYLTNPSRPAGAELSARDLEILINQNGDYIVVLDESEFELTRMESTSFLKKYDNLLIVRTFPRLMGLASTPGGYILAGSSKIELLRAAGHTMAEGELSETAAIAALRSVHVLHDDNRTIKDNMTLLTVRLRSLGVVCRTTPFDYILIDSLCPEKLAAYLISRGIGCRGLGHLRQMESFIAVHITGDQAAAATVEAFQKVPRELLAIKNILPDGREFRTRNDFKENIDLPTPENGNQVMI